jgi:trimethylamine--corrinoid protein Co-methyltransferase
VNTSLFPYQLLHDEAIERLHVASTRILSEMGIEFQDEEICALLRASGAEVKGQIARFDPALVESLVAKAPTQFTQLARNPQRNVVIGGDHIVFAPMYGPPFVRDLEHGRREATMADFCNFVKLAYLSPHIHHSGDASTGERVTVTAPALR